MSKANLLFVVTKLELGGAQKNVLDLASGLDPAQFRVFLFTAREGLLVEDALAIKGITVRRSRFLDRPVNPVKDLFAFLELCVFIRRNKINLVHTHSSKAGIVGRAAAAACGVPACHTVHGWSFNDRQSMPARMMAVAAEKAAGPFTRRFIVVSDHDLRTGLERAIGRPERYSLVRYGIKTGDYRVLRRDRDAQAPVIGTVACLKPQKAPDDLIRCAALVCRELPRARFLIAGDGVLRARTERLIRRAGLERNIELCGWRRDIPGFLASLDVFCLTSLWEGLPISVIEAMAAGLPVVCTDTGGIRDLIEHGKNGFIVPRADMEAMAGIIVRLARDRELRRVVGGSASRLPQEFEAGAMLNSTQRLYAQLIS